MLEKTQKRARRPEKAGEAQKPTKGPEEAPRLRGSEKARKKPRKTKRARGPEKAGKRSRSLDRSLDKAHKKVQKKLSGPFLGFRASSDLPSLFPFVGFCSLFWASGWPFLGFFQDLFPASGPRWASGPVP